MTFLIYILAIAVFFFVLFHFWDRKDEKRKTIEKEQERHQHEILNTQNKATRLPKILDNALDEYDKAGIKIPLDIIEDLQHETFTGKEDAIKTIEMHRTNWKFENQKKLIRR